MSNSITTARGAIVIREASLADAIQFRELRLEALQDSPTAFPADYMANVNHPVSFWEDRLKTNGIGTIFFAEHENQLIGMMGIRRGESSKTKHSASIWGVYVRPKWRGLRIAESLIEACIEWAKSKDVIIVKLGVTAASTSAVRCYQRCGFTIYGTEPRGIFHDGQYYDGYLMYRDLNPTKEE
jgi:RimJ/RimL family protein N-acetyltransferase